MENNTLKYGVNLILEFYNLDNDKVNIHTGIKWVPYKNISKFEYENLNDDDK